MTRRHLVRSATVVSCDGYRHVSRIKIDRVAEKHNLDRRDKQDQRDRRSIVDEMQDFNAGHSQSSRNSSAKAIPANKGSHPVLREDRLENASTASSSRIATGATLAFLMLAMRRRASSAAASATTRRLGPCG